MNQFEKSCRPALRSIPSDILSVVLFARGVQRHQHSLIKELVRIRKGRKIVRPDECCTFETIQEVS